MSWMHIYFLLWGTAALCSLGLTFLLRKRRFALGFIDHPLQEQHKKHQRPVSTLGGPAIFLAWLLTLGGGLAGALAVQRWEIDSVVQVYLPGVWGTLGRLGLITCGGASMLALGLIDDRRPLRASTKLVMQALICGVVAAAGVRVTLFIPYPLLSWGVTLLWMLLIVNAINIFDNMDGMAGGCAVTAALLFFLIAALQEQYFVALLSGALGGAALGFLFFNWPPARIFMGDSGSHFLGYMLAVLGALITYYSPAKGGTPVSVLIPVLILALPLFDFFAVIFIRLRRGTPIYQADNQHLSHRFVELGLSRRGTAWVVNLLGLAIGAGALPLLWLPTRAAAVVLIQAGAMLALVSILHTVKLRPYSENDEQAGR